MSKFYFYCLLFVLPAFTAVEAPAQYLRRCDTIPVKENGNWLKNPWAGGHNFIQISEIDINQDGIKDLFVFDRTGNKISTYINKGTPNTVDYVDSSYKYARQFPHLEDWALLRDYNCDGLPDIFTYPIMGGGIKVYKNISTLSTGLQFVLVTPPINFVPSIQSNYGTSTTNLYVSRVDVPTIEDMDCDGDLDVITMDMSQTYFEFHINKSKELFGNCDSLKYMLSPNGCWGDFTENQNGGCSAYLNTCRTFNYDSLFSTPSFQENHLITRNDSYFESGEEIERGRHAGNCSLCFDNDGDGDKEIFLGQLACCNIIMLKNGGTCTNANMSSKDTIFPDYDITISIMGFPCGYYVDVNNDNARDLIVSPNAPNVSINNQSIWYYKNTGTDNAPIFKREKRNLFQDEMIDAGEGASPAFFDFDSDGLTDLLISNYYMDVDSCIFSHTYEVQAYKNIGTASSPKFNLVSTDYANLSIQLPNIAGKHLAFGDLDGDGDADMFIGDYNGLLHYFQNTAGAGNPANFVLSPTDPYLYGSTPLDVGNYATPQLIDADRDGDLDLLIGESYGNLNYYKNIGTPTAPTFTLVTTTLGGVDVLKQCCSGYSVPFMFDSAGSYRLIVASEAVRAQGQEMGWIWYFNNIDGNLGGNFTLVDSMYQNIWEGIRMTISGSDVNNDGLMDFAIGNYCGGVAMYLGDSIGVSVHELSSAPFDFLIFPNPSSDELNLNISDFSQNEKYELNIYNSIGEKCFSSVIRHASSVFQLHLPNGVYTCEIKPTGNSSSGLKTENIHAVKKWVVLK